MFYTVCLFVNSFSIKLFLCNFKGGRMVGVGIYFRSSVDESLKKNSKRENNVPLKGILATAKNLNNQVIPKILTNYTM